MGLLHGGGGGWGGEAGGAVSTGLQNAEAGGGISKETVGSPEEFQEQTEGLNPIKYNRGALMILGVGSPVKAEKAPPSCFYQSGVFVRLERQTAAMLKLPAALILLVRTSATSQRLGGVEEKQHSCRS